MQCLWASANRKIAYLVAGTLSLAGLGCIFLWSVATTLVPPPTPPAQSEKSLSHVPAHISEFSPVAEALALPKCGDVRLPEALLTPDPLLQTADDDVQVRVSFIIGADGRVHSAFVLDSGGPAEDQVVLHAVRYWRYRPALCNGVPTDYEAKVRFTAR